MIMANNIFFSFFSCVNFPDSGDLLFAALSTDSNTVYTIFVFFFHFLRSSHIMFIAWFTIFCSTKRCETIWCEMMCTHHTHTHTLHIDECMPHTQLMRSERNGSSLFAIMFLLTPIVCVMSSGCRWIAVFFSSLLLLCLLSFVLLSRFHKKNVIELFVIFDEHTHQYRPIGYLSCHSHEIWIFIIFSNVSHHHALWQRNGTNSGIKWMWTVFLWHYYLSIKSLVLVLSILSNERKEAAYCLMETANVTQFTSQKMWNTPDQVMWTVQRVALFRTTGLSCHGLSYILYNILNFALDRP